jgi:hypothetical protein
MKKQRLVRIANLKVLRIIIKEGVTDGEDQGSSDT